MNNSGREMPIFVKTQAFLAWLIPLTNHFPKIHRHTITQRLINAALDFQERLLEADSLRDQLRQTQLIAADANLNKVRHYWRLVCNWRWISLGQYEHGSRLIAELGRLLGAWRKQTLE